MCICLLFSLSSSRGSSLRSRRDGIEGPKMSVSKMPVRTPRRASDRARLTVHGSVQVSSHSAAIAIPTCEEVK